MMPMTAAVVVVVVVLVVVVVVVVAVWSLTSLSGVTVSSLRLTHHRQLSHSPEE